MSKLLRREIKRLKKENVNTLDAYTLCKRLDDRLTIKKFKELWN